jgi:transposase
LGISTKSLYTWKAEFSQPDKARDDEVALASEVRQLKQELARVPRTQLPLEWAPN